MYLAIVFFFQAEDGIRDLVRSRGLGDVYKRQVVNGEGTVQMTCHLVLFLSNSLLKCQFIN